MDSRDKADFFLVRPNFDVTIGAIDKGFQSGNYQEGFDGRRRETSLAIVFVRTRKV